MSKNREPGQVELRIQSERNAARTAATAANLEFWELARLFAPDLAKEIREYRGLDWGATWADDDHYARSALIKAAREKQWKNMTNTQKLEMLYREKHG